MTTTTFLEMKKRGEKITVLTGYDLPFGRVLDAAGVDIVLVGDSLGNVVLGYDTTIPVTMEEMIHHTRAVCRGVRRAFVVFDMPFLSYQVSAEEAVRNAGRAMKETGCKAVKLEGGRSVLGAVRAIADAGIPVVGHLGLTPQSVHQMGGYRVQGKGAEQARRIADDAAALEEAGAFMIVLECVPWKLAAAITKSLRIPTIGIGAGLHCDGQVLVLHDMINFSGRTPPRFAKVYMDFEAGLQTAVREYVREVREGVFPGKEHSFEADESALDGPGGEKQP